MSIRGLFTSLLVALSLGAADASAGEFVEIQTGPATEPVRLIAYLTRPPGAGPFSAVVLLHGCGGFHSSMISWADRLSRFGYAVLAVDSFGPRGIDQHCNYFPDQATDGFAALRYLATRDFVRPSHVSVMGFSLGGGSALAVLEKGPLEQRHVEKFRAGIAFYPPCQYASGIMTGPTLVLIGAADDWALASSCEAMVAGRTELGAPRAPGDRSLVELVVYPGAHHGFDQLELSIVPTRGVTFQGHRIEYNEEALKDSIARVRDFLRRTIGTP